MITLQQLTPVGRVIKPHGINGELNIALDDDAVDAELNPMALRCIVMDIDGIFVPFFINSCRNKGAASRLVTIDGVDSDADARRFVGKTIYALSDEFSPAYGGDPEGEDDDGEGFYAADLIGFTVADRDTGTPLGEITDIEDSTDNVLFIIARPDGSTVLIPVADEFISSIDTQSLTITVDLPDGLLEL